MKKKFKVQKGLDKGAACCGSIRGVPDVTGYRMKRPSNRSAFVRGFFSVFDLSVLSVRTTTVDLPRPLTPAEAWSRDRSAMRGDWMKIGGDFATAFEHGRKRVEQIV